MEVGEAYSITDGGKTSQYEVVKVRKQSVVFREYVTNKEKTLTSVQFHAMRDRELLVRSEGPKRSHRLERTAFLKPGSDSWKTEMGWLSESKTLLFFVTRFDDEGWCTRSDDALEELILRHDSDADALGLTWNPTNHRSGEHRKWPHPSSIRRALELGEPGERTLADIYDERGKHSEEERWDPFVLNAIDHAIEEYWKHRRHKIKHALAIARSPMLKERTRRKNFYGIDMKIPDNEMIRRRIHKSCTRERFASKYGDKNAAKIFDGYSLAMEALGPGHVVQVDHTWTDTKLVIKNLAGKIIARRRAYYCGIVDVFSGALVAGILSWEPPSIGTLAAVVRQMIRPKTFLRDAFYEAEEWAIWICCVPKIICLDNGLEAMRGSFELSCDTVGFALDVAPLGTPKYKVLIERTIEAVNSGIWHLAPGAIPFKPHVMAEADLCPDIEAEWTLEYANKMLWKFIATQHHCDVSRTRHMSRGLKWQDGISEVGQKFLSQEQLDYIDQAFGHKKENVSLSNDGVKINNHAFGFDSAVTGLLEDLLPSSRIRVVRGQTPKRGSVKVDVTWYADDCSYVAVYNRKKKKYVKLYNRDPFFRNHPMSWNVAKAIAKFFDARNEAFESEDRRYERIVEFAAMLEGAVARPTKEMPRAHRLYEQLKNSPLLSKAMVETTADPTPRGTSRSDIAVVLPGLERNGDIQISRRPRVGGQAATRKGMETRARNREAARGVSAKNSAPAQPRKTPPPVIDGVVIRRDVVRDHEAYVLGLMDDLD